MVHADPEIAYFVSSLAVFEGQPYLLVQHPGTPLLVLGTAIFGILFLFVGGPAPAFVARLVLQPVLFFLPAHLLLVTANIACAIAWGVKALPVRRPVDALLAAAVPASFFALLPQSFTWTFYWTHNAFAFPAGGLILLFLLRALRRGRPPTTR